MEKHITLNNQTNKSIITEKTVNKRLVTKNERWNFEEHDFSFENQLKIILQINDFLINDNTKLSNTLLFVLQFLKNKIYGYYYQDMKKNKYNSEEFVSLNYILNKLIECNMECFYCNQKVQIIYENVREPKQWSLERIDNEYGHNNTNVVIACLHCNLKRKTMYHERFLFTKQMQIIKHK